MLWWAHMRAYWRGRRGGRGGAGGPGDPAKVSYIAGAEVSVAKGTTRHARPDAFFWPTMESAFGANLGFTGSAWWARVDLRNGGTQPLVLLLRQHYPLIDFIDAWVPAADGGWKHAATGDRRNFDTREFAHRDFVFAVELPAGAERSVYLRFASSGPVDISLTLDSQRELVGAINLTNVIYGVLRSGYLG